MKLPVTVKDVDSWTSSLASIIKEFLARKTGELETRLADAERRIVELQVRTIDLEKRGATVYRGVWQPAEYAPGDMCTFDSGLWVCRQATSARPAQSESWQLAVRRGGR